MSTVVAPGSNLPLPVGISEGQQFVENHLTRFRSGVQADGLGGAINFFHEIPNATPRNVFEDISDQYTELGLRRYRCYYLFNSHYTLSIPNIVLYVGSNSINTKSRISIALGITGFNGTEQRIGDQFTDPVGLKWNSATTRQEALFLREPLKPRNWHAIWVREILDFGAQNTPFNWYSVTFEASDPIQGLPGRPDFNIAFVGNMGCGETFRRVLDRIIAKKPSAVFTLGNNSYTNTGDCWLQRINPLRGKLYMAFGAHDWYKPEYADRIDDSSNPRLPDDWHWPEPEQPCGDDRYQIEDDAGPNNEDVDPVTVSELHQPEDDPEAPTIWKVTVFDKDEDEGGNIVLDRDGAEETFTFGKNETNARAYKHWLQTCEVTEGEVDLERFNMTLQNQYRNYFEMNNFDGYQSVYADNINFLVLNTNAVTRGHSEDSPQYRFAEASLKAAYDNAFIDYRFIIAYRPGFVAPNGSSIELINTPAPGVPLSATGYQGPIRSFNELYKPLFEKYKTTGYISGNVRNYQRTGILKHDSGNWIEPNENSPSSGPNYKLTGRALDGDGIIYMTVGTGGATLQANQNIPSWVKRSFMSHGYLLMTSLNNGLTLEFRFYDINDQLLDFFSIGKTQTAFIAGGGGGGQGPSPGNNAQGIKLLYSKKVGGSEWDSRLWHNNNSRTVPIDCGADPDDPSLKHRSNSGSVFTIDGQGVGKITKGGRAPVTGTWQNVEQTLYIKCPASGFGSNGTTICHMLPKTEHYCIGDQNVLFGGYNLYVDYRENNIYFKKEETHAIGYTPRLASQPVPLVADKFQGFKCICYNIPNTSNVKLEAWFDDTEGFSGGTWTKITEWSDDGTEEIGGETYPPTTAAQGSMALRTDTDETQDHFLEYKWWHGMEINPPGTEPGQGGGGTPPSPEPPPVGGIIEGGVKMMYPKIGNAVGFDFSSGTTDRAQWVADLPKCFVNLEVTGYLKIDDVNEMSEEVSIKVRGGPHTDSDPDAGSCYIIGIGYDGSVNSQYEEPHPDNHPMPHTRLINQPLGNDITGKWFGIKAIVYKNPSANNDKIECWIDTGGLIGGTTPANQWVKFWETTSTEFTGQCNGDGEERAYFRLDEIPNGDNEENVELRFASCREISVT